jgi:arsenite methyltransferase
MEDIREIVREKYGQIAQAGKSCCGPGLSCCGAGQSAETLSIEAGYSKDELQSVPDEANMGLGCGNPTAFASLREGEVVLDLGSGGGLDCFLAAQKVGPSGKVIGVDMTPDMVSLARKNAAKGNDTNVEFRLGEIENLPAADNSVDVIISNCVINLSPDKKKVFEEIRRVLKPGGRFMVSDIVLLKALPKSVKENINALAGCVGGASLKEDYLEYMASAGFTDVRMVDETNFRMTFETADPILKSLVEGLGLTALEVKDIARSVVSLKVEGWKKTNQ